MHEGPRYLVTLVKYVDGSGSSHVAVASLEPPIPGSPCFLIRRGPTLDEDGAPEVPPSAYSYAEERISGAPDLAHALFMEKACEFDPLPTFRTYPHRFAYWRDHT